MTPANLPRPDSHKYDDRRLTPYSFLLEVMHDPFVALELRVDVAGKLMLAGPGYVREPDLTIRLPRFGSVSERTPSGELQ